MFKNFLIKLLKLVARSQNREATERQQKISPTTTVNNGTINIDIHMDRG